VRLSCFKAHFSLFEDTELLDQLFEYPLIPGFREVLDLGNVMERETDVHATDAFAKALGVTVTDYKPIYKVSDAERQWAATLRSTSGRPVCGIQMRASTRNRDYTADNWLKVITELVNRGWDVLLFGSPGQIPPLPKSIAACPHIYDLSRAGYTFRQSAAILAGCDAFCGVDSALIHLCHALDVPAFGLYGPFPWQIRTAKAPLTTALSGVGDCAPCFHHAHAGHHFPKDKPCAKLGHCTVLAGIPPERVVAKVDALRKR
jgi:ADP-heptose:LPS heptosyltransferase